MAGIMSKEECRKISIHQFPWGPDTQENLALNDITITLYHKTDNYYISLKNKWLKKTIKIVIEKKYFEDIFIQINTVNFDKLYSENSTGDDGRELEIEIYKKEGLKKHLKRVELFSPYPDDNKMETRKIFEIIKNIKDKVNFNDYYKIIRAKRRGKNE